MAEVELHQVSISCQAQIVYQQLAGKIVFYESSNGDVFL